MSSRSEPRHFSNATSLPLPPPGRRLIVFIEAADPVGANPPLINPAAVVERRAASYREKSDGAGRKKRLRLDSAEKENRAKMEHEKGRQGRVRRT